MEKLPVTLAKQGVGDLDVTFTPKKYFTLVFLRCHFSADPASKGVVPTDPAVMTVDLDSHLGYEHDARLYTLEKDGGVGLGRDARRVLKALGSPDVGSMAPPPAMNSAACGRACGGAPRGPSRAGRSPRGMGMQTASQSLAVLCVDAGTGSESAPPCWANVLRNLYARSWGGAGQRWISGSCGWLGR